MDLEEWSCKLRVDPILGFPTSNYSFNLQCLGIAQHKTGKA